MNRSYRARVATETVDIINRGWYEAEGGRQVRVREAIEDCLAATLLVSPAEHVEPAHIDPEPRHATRFEVRNETTLSAARRMVVERSADGVLVLNFASAKNPGGGFLAGSAAQEESLARSSALFASLRSQPDYYEANRDCHTALYTDHMILSPRVPVFRHDDGQLLQNPYLVGMLTAPAVNAGAIRQNEPSNVDKIMPAMASRIDKALSVAAKHSYEHLVLGAWGCGVFGNDPEAIAELFANALLGGGRFSTAFRSVAFAVFDGTPHESIAKPFRRRFTDPKAPTSSRDRSAALVPAAMLGSAIGDALGVPVEFRTRGYLRTTPVADMLAYGTHNQPAGTWSDDTSLTLCLAESIAEAGIDFRDQANRFVSWMENAHWTPHGDVFDIGNATGVAITRLSDGVEPTSAGPSGERSCGNGSLMRILPLGLYLAHADMDRRAEAAASGSRLTHGHPRCQLSCVMFCEVVAALVRGESFDVSIAMGREILRDYMAERHPDEAPAFERLLSPSLGGLPEEEISASGYVIHCLEASLWCAQRASSYRDGVLAAVNLGEDTDTTATVAGALLGLRFGVEQLPDEWIDSLARLPDVRRLIDRFQDTCLSEWSRSADKELPMPPARQMPPQIGSPIYNGRHLSMYERDGWEYATRNLPRPAVGIVAVTDSGNVVLVEQRRPPVGQNVFELPAGLSGDIPGKEDEALLESAQRELLEETGYVAARWTELVNGYSSPGMTDESVTLFLAEGLTKVGPGGGDQSERITVHEAPLEGALAWLRERGAVADMKTLAGLFAAHEEIRSRPSGQNG